MRIQIRRFYSRIYFSLIIITQITVLYWSRVRIVIRDFAYLTRPVWDYRPKPWNVITHYESENSYGLTDNKICELHGWRLRNSIMNHESLKQFKDFVDIFIVLEADRTFTGKPKPLILQENLSHYLWAHKKFRPSIYTGLKELSNGESLFENESNESPYESINT